MQVVRLSFKLRQRCVGKELDVNRVKLFISFTVIIKKKEQKEVCKRKDKTSTKLKLCFY